MWGSDYNFKYENRRLGGVLTVNSIRSYLAVRSWPIRVNSMRGEVRRVECGKATGPMLA